MEAAIEEGGGMQRISQGNLAVGESALLDSIFVNYDALDWTIGFCRKIQEGTPRDDIEGWLIYHDYMQVLGLDANTILRKLSELTDKDAWTQTPPFDFWRRAIQKVACRHPDGILEFYRPGQPLPEPFLIDSLFFTPDPAMIPYYDITEAMKREGRHHGVKLKDLLFQYNGKIIRSASALADMVLNRNLQPRRVCDALDRWRDSVAEGICTGRFISGGMEEPVNHEAEDVTEDIDEDCYTPESLKGKMISSVQLAEFLQRTPRTLRRWDALGCVPTGKTWTPGRKISGNVVLYEISVNWPAIKSMMPPSRDPRNDRQIAHELGVLSASEVNWTSGLDE